MADTIDLDKMTAELVRPMLAIMRAKGWRELHIDMKGEVKVVDRGMRVLFEHPSQVKVFDDPF
jgi:hypothetical protein